MRKLFIILCLSLCSSSIWAQLFTDTVYFDSQWERIEDESQATYYRIISNDTSGKIQFLVNDYYMSGQLQMSGTYKSIHPDKKVGPFVYYYENGQKKIECLYKDDQLEGTWKEWFPEGLLKSKRQFQNGLLEGTSEFFNLTGKMIRSVQFKEGKKHGTFKTFFDNGGLLRKDIYREGEFDSGTCYTQTGQDTIWYPHIIKPSFQGRGIEAFKEYVLRELQYPDSARADLEVGRVMVRFTVNNKGEVRNASLVQEDKSYFNAEALRVINNSPKWEPGRRDGKPFPISLMVPISFWP